VNALINSQDGIPALLASIAVVLSLHLVVTLGKFAFDVFKKKSEKSDQEITEISLALNRNTDAVRQLQVQISVLEQELKEVRKFKLDTQRLFSAVKIMAGKKWPEIRKALEAEALPD
jgi:uncharacterized protein YlxW (UPF0749 family)